MYHSGVSVYGTGKTSFIDFISALFPDKMISGNSFIEITLNIGTEEPK